ncbi:CidA/LrgA family protein [Paenibacillus tyrfis]|uniref:Murein hydrolase transporter LrgA n=1 Tax=Paenibacillus tyrfis TaxID=1501230 RepID=A0A081P0Y3_9BACL|nr:CidA/LrgA family protein [Paenibacillus tyrfis]KEQ24356.1 murein hydrolase transporter LrgA [Paenibacillus tyrfis]
MRGFAILLGFYLLGTILQLGLKLPLPANVIGLILFTASLFLKWVKVEWVEEAGSFLIKHMLLLFAPIVVGTMVFFSWIGEQALTILVSLFASTFGVLLVTGWTAKLFGGGGSQKEGDRRHDVP